MKRFLTLLSLLAVHIVQAAEPIPRLSLAPAWQNLKTKRPLWLEEANDGTKRMFLVEQGGKILILPGDRSATETKTFLDISDRKPHVGNEEGLLGFALHPKFKSNKKFYIYYSQQGPRRSVISEWSVQKGNPDLADPASERILMTIPQPYENHNGGCILFGPDGFLYIASGDGGSAKDPHNYGQNQNSLLGKILRIGVDPSGDKQYTIPRDNPFVKEADARPEIFATGFRNPWRFSFDPRTKQLWAADVGQDKWEEIHTVTKGGNYGWSVREGFENFKTNQVAKPPFVDPVIVYPHKAEQTTNHTPGLSVTGGYVYRGAKVPSLQGVYIYGDYVSGTIWGLKEKAGKAIAAGPIAFSGKDGVPLRNIASFAQDKAGEVYVLCFDGVIYEFRPNPAIANR